MGTRPHKGTHNRKVPRPRAKPGTRARAGGSGRCEWVTPTRRVGENHPHPSSAGVTHVRKYREW